MISYGFINECAYAVVYKTDAQFQQTISLPIPPRFVAYYLRIEGKKNAYSMHYSNAFLWHCHARIWQAEGCHSSTDVEAKERRKEKIKDKNSVA